MARGIARAARAATAAAALATALGACRGFPFSRPEPVPHRIADPRRPDARLAVLWVGHATVLLQIDDKFVLTDPFLTDSVGQIAVRLKEPGIDPANLPRLDAVLISHMHFDHLSLGSLDLVEDRTRRLFVPRGGLVYVPNYRFDARELSTWASFEEDGLRVTAVPVKHVGFRYGVDAAWMTSTFTGYVLQYHGVTVYFAGDTAYDAENFAETAARFPSIDLALVPIAPIHPRAFMEATHVDPPEAVQAFVDLGARAMVPIHFDTLVNGLDDPGEAPATLVRVWAARGLDPARLHVLPVGGQDVILRR
jgi:N-acyl-phosphatidylethanolamine-hydrolysing phospholipase D